MVLLISAVCVSCRHIATELYQVAETSILGNVGTVQKVTKMKSGYLLTEATRAKQSKMIRDTTSFLNIHVKCTPHRSHNSSKGVIRDHGHDLYDMSWSFANSKLGKYHGSKATKEANARQNLSAV